MRLGLTYDLQTDPADERQAEFDPPGTVDALETALRTLGYHVTRLGNAAQLLAAPWRLEHVDLVFNIAEGSHGRCREAWVPMLLEQWNVPCVGSGAAAQALGLDKVMSKRLAQASGLPTPRWCVVTDAAQLSRAPVPPFPVIVKPRHEGSGLGIDPGAVVSDADALQRRVAWVIDRFRQPCLIESFIPFAELTVFLIGNRPPMAFPAIQRPLDPVSRLSCHVARAAGSGWFCPAQLTPDVDREAHRIAVGVFDALRCRDWARVDLRLDAEGRCYFLEINPLPSVDPAGSLGLLAEYLGTTYAALVGQVVEAALMRLGKPLRAAHRPAPAPRIAA